jgi:hypothetical protein
LTFKEQWLSEDYMVDFGYKSKFKRWYGRVRQLVLERSKCGGSDTPVTA